MDIIHGDIAEFRKAAYEGRLTHRNGLPGER